MLILLLKIYKNHNYYVIYNYFDTNKEYGSGAVNDRTPKEIIEDNEFECLYDHLIGTKDNISYHYVKAKSI